MTSEAPLRERIHELEVELAAAKEMITFLKDGGDDQGALWLRMGVALKLTRRETDMLCALYDARDVATFGYLEDRVWGDALRVPAIRNVFIHKLRKKIGAWTIENVHGRGYRLTEPGRALVRQNLAAVAREPS